MGSLSNDDGDGNENGKKAIGLLWQNNNFARASRFFVHFLAVVARLRHETVSVSESARRVEYVNATPNFFLEMVLSDSNPENYSPTFDKLNEDR